MTWFVSAIELFWQVRNRTSTKATWIQHYATVLASAQSLFFNASSVLIRRRIPVVIPHPESRSQMRQSVMFHRESLTDAVAAQRFVPHACALASEEPNHNPQPAYKIPAANAGRMISTRKSVFSVNSSDAHQNGSEEVQKPYYNQSVIRNYMESSRPL